MKCPVCKDTDLVIADRQGVEIDYCPQCRGVWLDRGELDKIIERSGAIEQASRAPVDSRYDDRDDDDDYYDEDRRNPRRKPQKRKKRESFLEELFDFDLF